MLALTFALVLCAQVRCEWVQISQQHYKKPLRPAHEHPLLATVNKPSETTRPAVISPASVRPVVDKNSDRPTEEQESSPVVKVNGVERTTKRNRIYINHTLHENSWDTDFNDHHDFVSRKPLINDAIIRHETKSKGDVLVIRRPDNIGNTAKTDKPAAHRTVIPGNVKRVHLENNKSSHKTPKPIEEYKGPIEVMNMADLTAEDTINIKLDEDIIENDDNERKSVTKNTTAPVGKDKRKKESPKTDQNINRRPNHETDMKQPTVFKGITNMRRVEIVRTTKPTLTEEFNDNDAKNVSVSTKPEFNGHKNGYKNKATTTAVTPYKFPNIGHVNRVNATRPTRKPKPPRKFSPTQSANEETYNPLERVDKPIRKTTNEKTFPVRTKTTSKNHGQNRIAPSPEDVMLAEIITEDEEQGDIKVHKVASIGTIKRVPNPTKTPDANRNKLDKHDLIKQTATPSTEKEFDEDVTVEDEYSDHSFIDQYKNNDDSTSMEEVPIHATVKSKQKLDTITRRPEINPQIERYGPNLYKHVKPSKRPGNGDTEDIDYNTEHDTTTERNRKTTKSNLKTESSNQHNTKRKENVTKTNTATGSKDTENYERVDEEEEPLSNNKKSNAMETLMKFLKTVTEIIARNTRRGVHGKLRYLEDLRDTIMANIEERIDAAFPDDPPATRDPGLRGKRSAEPRGHVEFPSSEGALMTISFLTFAVYLIKLVLQVIQAYKNKTMMMMPTVVAAVGRAYSERRTKS